MRFALPTRLFDAMREAGREERPRHERGVGEERVGNAVRRHMREASEEEREHDHREQRLEHRPSDPEHGLLVADLEVAPDEEVQQLAIGDDLTQPQSHPAAGRLDAQRVRTYRRVGHWRRRTQALYPV